MNQPSLRHGQYGERMRQLPDATPSSVNNILNQINTDRDYYNKNNIRRTNYYMDFWLACPEIPWSLAANVVSRNAGYVMSDLVRYQQYAGLAADWLATQAGTLAILCDDWATALGLDAGAIGVQELADGMDSLFEFLEAGNFLIFYDAFVMLEAYRYAKKYDPDNTGLASEIFALLGPNPPTASTEQGSFGPPLAAATLAALESYFGKQMWQQNYSDNTNSDVQSLFLLQVCNEQNYIETRLVNNGATRLGSDAQWASTWRRHLFALFVNNFVCLPLDTLSGGKADKLVVIQVKDFTSLDDRIGTGRTILSAFSNPTIFGYITSWATKNKPNYGRPHYGTRADYNATDFTFDINSIASASIPGTYSPPLATYDGCQGVWSLNPGAAYPGLHIPAELEPDWSPAQSSWVATVAPLSSSDPSIHNVHDLAELSHFKLTSGRSLAL